MNARVVYPVPPPLPRPKPQPPASGVRWKIALGTLILAALLILAEFAWLRGRRQTQRIIWANAQVEDKIAAARVLLNRQRWDEAIHRLEDAIDVEGATNRDTARPVLEQARRGQAESLLEAAGIALAHRRSDDALRLLRAYLDHPQAEHLDRARSLRAELERALSDDEARQLLGQMSDEALTVFAERGQLTADDGMHTAATRTLFHETLRRNLPAEQSKRAAQREVTRLTAERRAAERSRRIARLRATPAFHSLSSFLAQTQEQLREQSQLDAHQDAELNKLFQALGVRDAAEKEQLRADLLDHRNPLAIREQIERKRSEVKNAFRREPEFDRTDAQLFDQLVDQEVDKALRMLP